MNEQEMTEKWQKMSESEKIKYNGFQGFLKGESYSTSSLFRSERKVGRPHG